MFRLGKRVLHRLLAWCLLGTLAGFVVFEVNELLAQRAHQIVRSHATARAMDQVRLGILPYVHAEDFALPHSEAKLADIEARLGPMLMRMTPDESGLSGVDLIAADGTIIYADEPTQVGKQASRRERAALEQALGGQVDAAPPSSAETASNEPGGDGTVEVYVPVVMDGVIVGAYEMDLRMPGQSSSWNWIWIAAGCVSGGLAFAVDRARRTLRRRVSAALARPVAAPSLILTRREREVLELLAAGRSYRSVATELVVSEETVRSHVKRILRKTGQANRTAAVTVALRAGAIQLPAGAMSPRSPARLRANGTPRIVTHPSG